MGHTAPRTGGSPTFPRNSRPEAFTGSPTVPQGAVGWYCNHGCGYSGSSYGCSYNRSHTVAAADRPQSGQGHKLVGPTSRPLRFPEPQLSVQISIQKKVDSLP